MRLRAISELYLLTCVLQATMSPSQMQQMIAIAVQAAMAMMGQSAMSAPGLTAEGDEEGDEDNDAASADNVSMCDLVRVMLRVRLLIAIGIVLYV